MNSYRNTDKDIHCRIYTYVIRCFKEIVRNIPKSLENQVIIRQLSASLTSVGANDAEADAVMSPQDFVAKYSIVRKEMKETMYWISIIKDLDITRSADIDAYINEGTEILKVVSVILSKCKSRQSNLTRT